MFIFYGIITLILLFALSAFWSGSETALTSLSKYRIKQIIALKKSLSKAMLRWLKSPYYLLTTILVGNTVTNLTLSFLATILVLHVFSPFIAYLGQTDPQKAFLGRGLLEFATWIVITLLLLILGEVTPKIYSRHHAEKITVISLPILAKIANLAGPMVWPVRKMMRIIFPQGSLVPVSRLTHLSYEEVSELIEEANSAGMLGRETSQMLERVLKLGELNVSRIMTPIDKIEAVDLDQKHEKFLDLIVESGQSRVPVYHKVIDNVAGFVHTKDLLWAWKNRHGKFSEDLIRPPYFVPSDKKVYDLMKEFQTGKTHIAFVTDPLNNLIGLVTLEDVLEEIVGEILDEYDLEEGKAPLETS